MYMSTTDINSVTPTMDSIREMMADEHPLARLTDSAYYRIQAAHADALLPARPQFLAQQAVNLKIVPQDGACSTTHLDVVARSLNVVSWTKHHRAKIAKAFCTEIKRRVCRP